MACYLVHQLVTKHISVSDTHFHQIKNLIFSCQIESKGHLFSVFKDLFTFMLNMNKEDGNGGMEKVGGDGSGCVLYVCNNYCNLGSKIQWIEDLELGEFEEEKLETVNQVCQDVIDTFIGSKKRFSQSNSLSLKVHERLMQDGAKPMTMDELA